LTLDRQFSVISEWKMENILAEFYYSDPRKSKTRRSHSVMAIRIKASRVWRSYIVDFGITLCMFILGMGTFALSLETDLGSRLSYCVVFLLADVTTLQIVSQKLPKISYITLFDGYAIICFAFLFLVTMWSCLAGSHSRLSSKDGVMFWVFTILLFFIQICFALTAIKERKSEQAKLSKTYLEIQEQIRSERCSCWASHQQTDTMSLKWDADKYVGSIDDLFGQQNAFDGQNTELAVLGDFAKTTPNQT